MGLASSRVLWGAVEGHPGRHPLPEAAPALSLAFWVWHGPTVAGREAASCLFAAAGTPHGTARLLLRLPPAEAASWRAVLALTQLHFSPALMDSTSSGQGPSPCSSPLPPSRFPEEMSSQPGHCRSPSPRGLVSSHLCHSHTPGGSPHDLTVALETREGHLRTARGCSVLWLHASFGGARKATGGQQWPQRCPGLGSDGSCLHPHADPRGVAWATHTPRTRVDRRRPAPQARLASLPWEKPLLASHSCRRAAGLPRH